MEQQEKYVEVCPVIKMRKKEKIESYKDENSKWKKEGIYPFSQYAKEQYPDTCIGNCEMCKNWKSITEKELWIYDNKTMFNHIKYILTSFCGHYLISLPFTLVAAPLFYDNVLIAFLLSLCIALLFIFLEEFNHFGISFEDWLGDRWECMHNE